MTAATPEKIIEATCKVWGVSKEEILAKGRKQPQAFARQVAMYLIYNLTNLSSTNVGNYFGNRNHATILWAVKRVEIAMESESKIKIAIIELKKYLLRTNDHG